MPISYEGKDYSFQGLEDKIKKQKPGIKSPGGYVHSIEEKEHIAQLRARLQKIGKTSNGPHQCEICGDQFDSEAELKNHAIYADKHP